MIQDGSIGRSSDPRCNIAEALRHLLPRNTYDSRSPGLSERCWRREPVLTQAPTISRKLQSRAGTSIRGFAHMNPSSPGCDNCCRPSRTDASPRSHSTAQGEVVAGSTRFRNRGPWFRSTASKTPGRSARRLGHLRCGREDVLYVSIGDAAGVIAGARRSPYATPLGLTSSNSPPAAISQKMRRAAMRWRRHSRRTTSTTGRLIPSTCQRGDPSDFTRRSPRPTPSCGPPTAARSRRCSTASASTTDAAQRGGVA